MYTYEEVEKSTLEYFNGNELATNVFLNKYALKDNDGNLLEKSPDDMHIRLANEFARIERKKFKEPMDEEKIYKYLKNYEQIIPGGSPLYGVGNNYKYVSLSNCFVVDIHDSIGGIFNADEEMAHIFKRRGGVGTDISKLRPKNTPVSNSAGTTTGAISFLYRFDHTGKEIGQNGRRSAQLISLSIHHPDVEEFIDIKNKEGKINSANLSVRLTDEFLKAVENDEQYELRWPVDSDMPDISTTVSAKKMWDKIIYSAWNMAEPGLLFWDNIIRESPADCYKADGFKTTSTNPCITKDHLITSPYGLHTVEDLAQHQHSNRIFNCHVEIPLLVNGETYISETGFFSNGCKNVIQLEFESGRIMKLTPDHKLMTTNGWKQAQDINNDDIILVHNHRNTNFDTSNKKEFAQGYCLGSFIGDGNISGNTAQLKWWGIDKQNYRLDAINLLKDAEWYSCHHQENSKSLATSSAIKSKRLYNLAVEKECVKDNIKHLSMKSMSGSWSYISGLIAGYFDADGTVLLNPKKGSSLRIGSSNIGNLQILQTGLNGFGIHSKIYQNRTEARYKMMPDGKGGYKEYYCQAMHELVISCDNIVQFEKYVKIRNKDKLGKLKQIIDGYQRKPNKTLFVDRMVSKSDIGMEEVFDCNVSDVHAFDANGVYTHNCSELPLSPYDSCRLLAINLFSCVDNPYTNEAKFNFKKLSKTAKVAQRFMDNLVDLESEKIRQIIKKVENDPEPSHVKQTELRLWQKILKSNDEGRRTGTGVTACGDVIAALGLKYGSEESIGIIEEIYKVLKLGCYKSSVDMAKELGAFKFYDPKKEENNPFIQRIKDEDPKLYKDMCQYGRRNIACLTTAPTGSISTQAKIGNYFGTTSGIEPCFMTSYKRRKRINQSDGNAKGTYTDSLGETWQEFTVNHSGYEYWLNENPDKDINFSPYYNSCASNIDWISRVELQAAAQKHVDHSISSTINLPKDISQKEVAKIYDAAWRYGLKGITVYRDGCRSGILVSNEEEQIVPEERPKELPCDVHHISIRGQQYFILVGLLDNKPYEVFAGRNGFLPKKVKTGTIIRKRKDFYKVTFNEGDEELSPITASTDEMEEVITRLTSGLLRVGTDMNFIVQQLEKVGEKQTEMHTFARGVSRALKRYISDGTKVDGTCPECGLDSLIRQEGCRTCQNCGFSKCL